ncbi:sensor histidine kinase [Paenibacillus dauci]|uniref:sensor histidine kinase n=1 Tax=Paenibacillus dauci TaxID=1567106 RepID=UPI0006971AD1|nr:sensor histidine kinase [Paenibacillus dauci]
MDNLNRLMGNHSLVFRLSVTIIMMYSCFTIYFRESFFIWSIYTVTMLIFVILTWAPLKLHPLFIITFSLFLYVMMFVNERMANTPANFLALLWVWFAILCTISVREKSIASFFALLTGVLMLIADYDRGFPYSMLISLVSIYFGVHSIYRYISVLRINSEQLQELETVHNELKHAHNELQENALQSIRYAALAERTRIAGEIHDGLGHHFTSLIVQLQALKWMIRPNPEQAEHTVNQLLDVSRQGLAEVRSVVRDWSVSERGVSELHTLASQVAERSGFTLNFQADAADSQWGEAVDGILYRILQESLTNIVRHAEASVVDVTINQLGDQVIMHIADNGVYREDTPLIHGFGLQNMIRRCEQLQGKCTFRAREGSGLIVEARLPLSFAIHHEQQRSMP